MVDNSEIFHVLQELRILLHLIAYEYSHLVLFGTSPTGLEVEASATVNTYGNNPEFFQVPEPICERA